MSMGMASLASERYMFIVYGLNPFKVVVKETYQVRERLAQFHVDVDMSIGGVPTELCFLCCLYELS